MPGHTDKKGKKGGNGKSSTGKKAGNGMKLKKGSQEAKDYMAKLRAKRGKK
tara:strand:- start:411 stop:563 length:153 start_codon:yes stop_codon:yes gene_type:complete